MSLVRQSLGLDFIGYGLEALTGNPQLSNTLIPFTSTTTRASLTAAMFVVDEEIVSNPAIPLPDPEFAHIGRRMNWQDKDNNSLMAPHGFRGKRSLGDPITGLTPSTSLVEESIIGNLVLTIENPTPAANDNFGYTLTASGNNILVGTPFDDTRANNAGSVYLFDGAGNNPQDARDIGTLDTNPFPKDFSDWVGQEDKRDFYRFELQANSKVIINLDGLSSNAQLFLGDENGETISSSRNGGNNPEFITQALESGIYTVLVRLDSNQTNSTNYNLTLSAEFIVDDAVVSNPGESLPDPEFNPIDNLVTWQDRGGEGTVWVAPVDPITGEFLLEQKTVVATGAVLGGPNGSEWAYGQNGAQILYTTQLEINGKEQLFIGRSFWNGTDWEDGIVEGTRGGYLPLPSKNPEDPNPFIKYNSPDGPAWVEIDNPTNGGLLPEGTRYARWVPGENSLVITLLKDGVQQVATYNIDTEEITWLTNDYTEQTRKTNAFMWKAPEFDNELVLMVRERNDYGSNWISIYRDLDGVGEWEEIKRIESPVTELPLINSPEPFVYDGKSYISFLASESLDSEEKREGAEVWLVSIDPNDDFVREVSGDDPNMERSDPETFVTDSGVFVYYTETTDDYTRIIHRADTGL